MFKEFREFAARGNVIDLAVGVIIGAAFGKIIASVVSDLIKPPLGMLIGGVDFRNLIIALDGGDYLSFDAAKAAGAPTINYGLFLNTVLEFLIVAFTIFLLIKLINRLKEPPAIAPQEDARECPFCVSRIPVKASRCPFCTSEVRRTT